MLNKNHLSTVIPALAIIWMLFSAFTPHSVPTVIILPLQATSSSELDHIAEGIASMLPSRISIPGKIDVIGKANLNKPIDPAVLDSREHTIRFARSLMADFILQGSIAKTGNSIGVDATVYEVNNPANSMPLSIQASETDLIMPETDAMAKNVQKFILSETRPSAPEEKTASAQIPAQKSETPVKNTAVTQTQAMESSSGTALAQEDTLTEAHLPTEDQPHPETPDRLPSLFEEKPFATYNLRSAAMQTIIAADIDGDETSEFIIATDDSISVYKPVGGTLETLDALQIHIFEDIVDIAAADLNANGIDELYVSTYEGQLADSSVYEKKDSGFSTLAENLPWFMKISVRPDQGPVLLGQKIDTGGHFTGEIKRLIWQDGHLAPRESISPPGNLGIYGFSECDLFGDGTLVYLGFHKVPYSPARRLAVYSTGSSATWFDPLGATGSPRTFMHQDITDDYERSVTVPLRIICEDVNSDGTIDVLSAINTKKKQLLPLQGFHEGILVSRSWDGTEIAVNWQSPVQNDYITDYTLADMDKDGTPELYVLSVAFDGMFKKPINTISGFRLAAKAD